MKKITTLILGLCVVAAGCSSDDEGNNASKCFKTTRVDMGCASDTIKIQSQQKGWKLDNIVVDGVNFKAEGEKGRYEKNFAWLTLKCSDDDITLITTDNYGKERSFEMQVTTEAGDKQTISGTQEEAEEGDIMAGDWSDCIHMSMKEGVFGAAGETFTINTNEEDGRWWFQEIHIYNNYENFKAYKADFLYYPITPEEVEYSNDNYFEKSLEWVHVKRDVHDLHVTLDANTSGKVRYFKLLLEAGDYFGWFRGCQSAE